MKYVRLSGNRVVEIIPDYALPVEKFYGPDFAAQCVEAPDNVTQDFAYIDGEFVDVSFDDAIDDTIPYIAKQCSDAIDAGSDVTLSDGSTAHFSYAVADQANVSEMFNAIVMGATEFPYHSDGEECRMYSAADVVAIYVTLSTFKTHHLTYHNQLKRYVKSLTTADEVRSVHYGQELTGEYLDAYNVIMAQAKSQMDNILTKMGASQNQD